MGTASAENATEEVAKGSLSSCSLANAIGTLIAREIEWGEIDLPVFRKRRDTRCPVPYLTFIAAFFLDCLVFVFFAAVEITTVHVSGRSQREELGLRIRHISRVAVPIAFVLSNAVIALNYFR